jgi:capsid protein
VPRHIGSYRVLQRCSLRYCAAGLGPSYQWFSKSRASMAKQRGYLRRFEREEITAEQFTNRSDTT